MPQLRSLGKEMLAAAQQYPSGPTSPCLWATAMRNALAGLNQEEGSLKETRALCL